MEVARSHTKFMYKASVVSVSEEKTTRREYYNSPWKSVLETFLGDIGGKVILRLNCDTCKIPIYLPDFYKECLDAWSDVSTTSVVSYDDIVNQTI